MKATKKRIKIENLARLNLAFTAFAKNKKSGYTLNGKGKYNWGN